MVPIRLLTIALLAFTTACSRPDQPRAAIVIVIDALRADHLGTYGYRRATSPNLDQWAREGRQYERAYSTSSWTLPSLASLHTGQYPLRHGAGMASFDGPDSIAANRLPPEVPTLAEAFADQHFATGAIVNNPLLEPPFGLHRGFQTYDYPQDALRTARRADVMVNRVEALLDRWRDRSFLLFIHFVDPHLDYDAPAPFRGRFSAAFPSSLQLPIRDVHALRQNLGTMTEHDRAFVTAAYDEEIAFVDEQLGRLRAALATRGLLDRLLLVVTADHGEELFEHGGFEHGHAMWEEVVRVPLIIWGPDVRAGRDSNPVSIVDIAPTLLEWTGGPRPSPLDGVSLWPNLTTGTGIANRTLLAQGRIYGRPEHMLLRWPLKVVFDDQLHPRRVNDLDRDPREQHVVTDEHRSAVEALSADLRTRVADAARKQSHQPADATDRSVLERLRSLGYIR